MTVGRSGCGVKMILTGLPKFLPTFVLEYCCMILYKKLFCYFLSMNEGVTDKCKEPRRFCANVSRVTTSMFIYHEEHVLYP